MGLLLSTQDIAKRLNAELPHWRYENGMLVRQVKTAGWKATVMAVNAIAHLAEAAWHHPDIDISYSLLAVRLSTHSAGGVTNKDFDLARKIEDVVFWHPGKEGGALEGTPDDPRHAYLVYDPDL